MEKVTQIFILETEKEVERGTSDQKTAKKTCDNKTKMKYDDLLKIVQSWYNDLDVNDDRAVVEFIERNSKKIDKNIEEFEISLLIDELKKKFEDRRGNIVLEELTRLVDSKRKR